MRKTIQIEIAATLPSVESVLAVLGIPPAAASAARAEQLATDAIVIYRSHARAVGLLAEISREKFERVCAGQRRDVSEGPLAAIYPRATRLALYAVTIGESVCEQISRLFEANHPALGALLDTVASEATELAARQLERAYRDHLRGDDSVGQPMATMPFSPGYCGWEISAQRQLFEALGPGEIGITLSKSYLMTPLKSISGVIVVGPREIFEFDPVFSFCDHCQECSCRERLERVHEV
ncbi:MAG: hypothetical protein JSV80_05520 [Acidobacteriota bacterium]|nr:MAG: hypothetical protein JSV80_05520 [Acidobacteriota bacterium]